MDRHLLQQVRLPRPTRIALGALAVTIILAAAAPAASAQQPVQRGQPAGGSTGSTATAILGTVRDPAGDPIAHALIVITPGGRHARSSEDGTFRFSPIQPGHYQIVASRAGFAPTRHDIDIPRSLDTLSIALTLVPTPLALPAVHVTGTTRGRDPLAVTRATTHLDSAQLTRELGATIAHALRTQPGIALRSMGPAAAMPVLRGLTGDRILVLQDGQRTADLAGSADDHGVTIDPITVQRMEVIRGPATLVYGNNALGGVINVITRDIPTEIPERVQWASSAQTESAYPGASASISTLIPTSTHSALSVRLGGRSAGDMRIPHDPALGRLLPNTWSRSLSGAVGIGHSGETVTGGAALQAYTFEYGLPHPADADPVSLTGHRYEGNGRAEILLPGTLFPSVEVHATSQLYAHDEVDERSGSVIQRFELATHTARATLRQGSHGRLEEGAWGLSALDRGYSASGVGALTPPATSRAFGIFTFQSVSLGVPSLELGVRLDQFRTTSRTSEKFGEGRSRTFRSVLGSVGLRVPINRALVTSFSISRSSRAPTVEELFSGAAHAGTGAVEFGNAELHAEKGMSLDGVLRLTTAGWNAQLAAYHHTIHDYVHLAARGDTAIGGATLPVLAYTQARAVMRGVEVSIERALTAHLVAGAMGDYLHAELAGGTPLSYMPPPRMGAQVRWDNGTFSFGADVHHEFRQARIGAADELPTPAHTIVRLHSGLRFRLAGTTHSIAIRAENLTNQLHREATSRVKDFAPGPGRNISLLWRVTGQM